MEGKHLSSISSLQCLAFYFCMLLYIWPSIIMSSIFECAVELLQQVVSQRQGTCLIEGTP